MSKILLDCVIPILFNLTDELHSLLLLENFFFTLMGEQMVLTQFEFFSVLNKTFL